MRKFLPAQLLPDIGGLFALLSFILLCLFSDGRALNDADTFWHIAAGQRMLADKAILTQDVFSHTAAGKPWTSHEWLAEIIMAAVHSFSGLPGVCIFFFLIASLSFWLLYIIVRQETTEWFSLFFVALAFIFSSTHLLARPHIFTWLLGGLTFFILRKQSKYLYILPLITIFWANLHGGFILGIVLQGIFLVAPFLDSGFPFITKNLKDILKKQRASILTLFFSISAVGVNPFGYSLYLFPFQVSGGVFAQAINEWLPPNLQREWLFRIFLLFIFFLLTQPIVGATWLDRLFLVFFINAALVHQRHISIASYFLAPYLAKATQHWVNPFFNFFKTKNATNNHELLKLSKWTGPIGIVFLTCVLLFFSSQHFPKQKLFFEHLIPIPEKRFPLGAFEYLSKNRISDVIFNEYSWGGFSIYFLGENLPVFIDGRADMYGEQIFGDYIKIVSLHKDLIDILNKHKVNIIFYPTDSPLIRYLKTSSHWSEIYADELATILRRI